MAINLSKRLANQLEPKDADMAEMREALRLQALAWRIIALIACADQQKGQQLARNMLFVSFPFVNPEAVKKIIEEYEPISKESPVFDPLPQTQVAG